MTEERRGREASDQQNEPGSALITCWRVEGLERIVRWLRVNSPPSPFMAFFPCLQPNNYVGGYGLCQGGFNLYASLVVFYLFHFILFIIFLILNLLFIAAAFFKMGLEPGAVNQKP